MDMLHLETDGAAASTILLSSGSWNVGLAFVQGAGEAATPHLWASLSGAAFGDTYFIDQPLLAADSIISAHKGAMLHVVLSAEFVAATSLTVTTLVNGVYATATTNDHTNHYMDPTPTNTLLDIASNTTCPVYLLRMWSAYEDDALVLADLYREARKVVPTGLFVQVAASELELTTVA
jgi:hypothetical protein